MNVKSILNEIFMSSGSGLHPIYHSTEVKPKAHPPMFNCSLTLPPLPPSLASNARLVAIDVPNASSSAIKGHGGCGVKSATVAETFTGSGRSKKEAELAAAQAALLWLYGSSSCVGSIGGTIPGTEGPTGEGDLQDEMRAHAFQGTKSEISLMATIGRLFLDDWKASIILVSLPQNVHGILLCKCHVNVLSSTGAVERPQGGCYCLGLPRCQQRWIHSPLDLDTAGDCTSGSVIPTWRYSSLRSWPVCGQLALS